MTSRENAELHQIARKIFDIVGDIPRQTEEAREHPSEGQPYKEQEVLLRRARSELARRKVRSKYLPEDMFAEGGYNILLDLFIADAVGGKVSVSDACIASLVPTTTALRQLSLLGQRGLLTRLPDATDGRRDFVLLTTQGYKAIASTLRDFEQTED
ncbi:hypothetical protein [Qipengyuania psychrotolerans]|uniref:MarR family transcriptional regulator n=1 Tax=Qipengyuania psychrotolerans TaxID=2867238 RepID=A0ABX8ZF98_9SPHN|nr:hypothetical protein [Qipengyuania psychrotolerans]QZD87657.1 hypothetical protein K3166_02850 [Qipengyuania psychrotolerans]